MSDWRDKELEAASRTIDRMGRQFAIMRSALESIATERSRAELDAYALANKALNDCRKIDQELWR